MILNYDFRREKIEKKYLHTYIYIYIYLSNNLSTYLGVKGIERSGSVDSPKEDTRDILYICLSINSYIYLSNIYLYI